MAHSKAYQYITPYDINHTISNYCKALSYPARIMIMRWLAAEGAKHPTEISEYIQLSRPTTSHHLACLEKAGLIAGFESGPYILYELNVASFQSMRWYLDVVFKEIEETARLNGNADELIDVVE